MVSDSVFPLHQDWEVPPLGEVCQRGGGNVQTGPFGSQLHASDYVAEGIPSVMPQNIGDNKILEGNIARITEADAQRLSKYRLRKGDIIYSRRGDVERRALVRESEEGWLCGTGCLRIRFGEGIVYPKYAAHYLGHPAVREWIVRHAHGATMLNLNTTILSELPFVLPPWAVQASIGDAIELYDQKIDLNRRINQTLEAMAQTIFKSWFVDFDPVKAKITAIEQGQDPLRAAMRAIGGKIDAELDQMPREHYDRLAATAALFPEAMEESELGEIPKGWNINQVGQFGKVVCGKTPSKNNPDYFGSGIPFIKIPDMHDNMYVVNPSEQLTALGTASQSKKTIPSGSICVSCIATVGKVVITHEPSQTNQQINSIIPKFPEYMAYLYFQMKEKEKEFHDLASGGSATLNMNTSTFSKIDVLTPNFELLECFSIRVESLFRKILSKQKESRTLAILRNVLLPKLLSGELKLLKRDAHYE